MKITARIREHICSSSLSLDTQRGSGGAIAPIPLPFVTLLNGPQLEGAPVATLAEKQRRLLDSGEASMIRSAFLLRTHFAFLSEKHGHDQVGQHSTANLTS